MTRRTEATGAAGIHMPSSWELIGDAIFGARRPLDCVQVEVTTRCTGQCTYCPHTTGRERWRSHDMDMATFGRIWPLMRRSGRVHLQGWGEPLLNPAFFDMAQMARSAGCQVSTTTCGVPMDPDLARRIVQSGVDIVAFSLAGTDAASNGSRRGVGFDRVCEAVTTLQTARRGRRGAHLKIHLAYLMLASEMEAVAGLPSLMQRLGVRTAIVSTLDYVTEPHLAAEGFTLDEPAKLARAAALLASVETETRRRGLGLHWELPCPTAPGTSCRENIGRSLFISADGWVSPCVFVNVPTGDPDPMRRVFGNVRDADPTVIWESAGFRYFRERLAGGDPDLPCRSCPKRFCA
jgi:MoaA/NifB/PqqE/SkfB family radical SAM enzyme